MENIYLQLPCKNLSNKNITQEAMHSSSLTNELDIFKTRNSFRLFNCLNSYFIFFLIPKEIFSIIEKSSLLHWDNCHIVVDPFVL